MIFCHQRKYYQAFHSKPILTLYRIQLDSQNYLAEKHIELPQKLPLFSINYQRTLQIKQQESCWSWQDIDEALRQRSPKGSNSSSLEYHQKNQHQRSWDHQQFGQKKIYKPTWDTWEEDNQLESEQKTQNKEKQQFDLKEQWQEQY